MSPKLPHTSSINGSARTLYHIRTSSTYLLNHSTMTSGIGGTSTEERSHSHRRSGVSSFSFKASRMQMSSLRSTPGQTSTTHLFGQMQHPEGSQSYGANRVDPVERFRMTRKKARRGRQQPRKKCSKGDSFGRKPYSNPSGKNWRSL